MRPLDFLTQRLRSDFVRHVSTYATGVTFSQVLAIVLTPLLSRLYQPEMFGALGVFSAITTIFTVFATLRYEQAILLPASDGDAAALLASSLAIATVLAGLFLMGILSMVLLLPNWNVFDTGWHTLIFWLPLGGVLGAYNACLTEWQVRHRAFYSITRATILQAFTNSAVALGFVFAVPAHARFGLVIALIFSLAAGTILMAMDVLRATDFEEHISLSRMWMQSVRYRKFPGFSLPGDLINSLATQLPLLLINRLFDLAVAGNFSMALRLLYVPSRFIGKAMRDVFRQRAAQDARGPFGCRAVFIKTGIALGSIALAILLPMIVAGPQIFNFVLGRQWQLAGQMVQFISPMVAFSFVASPLGWLMYLYEKQHIDLFWQIGLLASGIMAGIVGFWTHNVLLTVGVWSFGGCLLYLVYLAITYRLSGIQIQEQAR